MTSSPPESLPTRPVLDHLDLVAPVVARSLTSWGPATETSVFAIDAALSDTANFSEAYGIPLGASANCVLVGGSRAGEERVAACLVRADLRADVNGVVRRALDVRKASFLAMDQAVAESGMEYGGITAIGLPAGWRLLVDPAVVEAPWVVIGAGVRAAKLVIPGSAAALLPGAEVVEGLAR